MSGIAAYVESSEETPGVEGLGLLKGRIVRIPEKEGLKVPQIGWNDLQFPKESRLFKGFSGGEYVYFVHSYYLQAADESDVAATTEYGVHIHAAVERENVFACQVHPEKSADVGLKILENFVNL